MLKEKSKIKNSSDINNESPTSLASNAKVKLSFSAANGLIFALNALYFSFVPLYIAQFYAEKQLGILLSVGPFVAIFSPIIWGILTDKATYKNSVLMLTVIGAAVFYTGMSISSNFWMLFIMLFGLMFFMAPFNGLIDTVTLEYTSKTDIKYGPLRLCGTLGFGIVSLVLTLFIKGNYNILFITYIALTIAMCGSILIMPKIKGHASKRSKLSMKPLFSDKRLILYLSILTIVEFTFGFYLNFFPGYIINNLGMPEWVWGANVLLTVLPELPFFIYFNKLFNRFGIDKVFIVAVLMSLLRCVLFAFAINIGIVFATSLLTGACFAMLRYAVAIYINENVAPELKASGQSLMQGLASWMPRMVSGFLGGILVSSVGLRGGMLVGAVMCLLMLVIFFLLKDKKAFKVVK